MKSSSLSETLLATFGAAVIVLFLLAAGRAASQNPQQGPASGVSELQQRLAEVKQSAAQNKEALSHYSWQEQEQIAIKGSVKDT